MARTWLIRCRDWIVGEAGELVVLGAVAAKLLCGDPAEPGHTGHARHAARAAHAGAHARVAQPAEARAPRVATRAHAGRTDAAGTTAGTVAAMVARTARTARVVVDCPTSQERIRAAEVRARARTERALLVIVTLRPAPAAGARPAPSRGLRTVPAPRYAVRVAEELATVPAPARHPT